MQAIGLVWVILARMTREIKCIDGMYFIVYLARHGMIVYCNFISCCNQVTNTRSGGNGDQSQQIHSDDITNNRNTTTHINIIILNLINLQY